jgi:periplasmic protein TonB
MTKTVILLIFLWISLGAYCQNLFEKGGLLLKNGEYAKADSVLSLAIEASPFLDAYYNRAIARMKMNKMEGFCADIYKASTYNDKESENLYKQYCTEIDSINYTDRFEVVENRSDYLEIITKGKYLDMTEGLVYDGKNSLIAKYNIHDDFKFFSLTPIMPEFPGGQKKLLKFIESNLVFPKSEMDAKKKYPYSSLTIFVQFDVSEAGKVENVRIADNAFKEYTMKSVSENFRNEALRVVGIMADFKPGKFMGKPVAFRYILPIKFCFPQ